MVSQSNASTELYNLRWNSYFSNLTNAFINHQLQETLVDVTLSCEGQFLKAHRLVLSACSSYFQKIFETHTAPQMLVLLNDVKFKDLELIIHFMYKGEVKVADSDMQDFLALGKLLQVKGLCSVELQDKQAQTNGDDRATEVKVKAPDLEKNHKKEEVKEKKETPAIAPKKRKPSPSPPESPANNKVQKKTVKASPPAETSPDIARIPRPPNAFMIFANQWRKKLAVEYPNESNKDISVRLGNMWKALSQETKDAFYEDARKADQQHKIKYPGYYYSPKEARNRKAIASITKAVLQKNDSVVNVDSNETNDDELIEIKYEEYDSRESPQDSNGSVK